MKPQYVRRFIIALVPVTAILFSYQNCSPGYNTATGPQYDSEGNLIPPAGFSGSSEQVGNTESGGTSSGPRSRSTTQSSNDQTNSNDDSVSGTETDTESDTEVGSAKPTTRKRAKACVAKNLSAQQKALKTANAFDSAKKFLQDRRCNSFLSGPKGQARSLLREAHVENYCLSDIDNTLSLLRQVGRMAGMQDLDQYNAVEKWIDCFCNVTGRAICPVAKNKKPKDIFDVQDHFVDPKHRKPAMKLEDIPLNEDDVSGVDEVLND